MTDDSQTRRLASAGAAICTGIGYGLVLSGVLALSAGARCAAAAAGFSGACRTAIAAEMDAEIEGARAPPIG